MYNLLSSICLLFLSLTLSQLMQQKAPIGVADALKLLSGGKAFQSPRVRKYAVDVLRNASDEELHILLLQLVQALRYEPLMGDGKDKDKVGGGDTGTGTGGKDLSILASKHVPQMGRSEQFDEEEDEDKDSIGGGGGQSGLSVSAAEELHEQDKEDRLYSTLVLSPLGRFLVERACASTTCKCSG
jgi:hypothetical protein